SAPLDARLEREIECTEDIKLLIERLGNTANLYEQIEDLTVIAGRTGLEHTVGVGGNPVPVFDLISEVYYAAGAARLWSVVRRAAGLLKMVDVDLSLACAALLVAHKNVQVGRS